VSSLKKVAINTRFLLPDKLEGLGWYTYEICQHWVKQHPEVEFHFIFDRPYDKRYLFGPNVIPHVLSPPARHPFLWYLWFEVQLPKLLNRINPDVFFSPDNYASLRSKVPTVLTVQDFTFMHDPKTIPYLARKYYMHYFPKFAEHADGIVSISHFVKTEILKYTAVPKDRVQVVHNGLRGGFSPIPPAEQETIRQKWSAGHPYFFYVGALHPRKNVETLIRAFTQHRKDYPSSAKLLIAGRRLLNGSAIDHAFDESPYQSDIHFLGYVPEEELNGIMAAANAFLYLSRSEGFGLPLLEAMQAGVPVITTNVTSLPEVAGNAALLFDPDDINGIAGAMQEIQTDDTLRQMMIERGFERVKAFNWANTAEGIWEVLARCARLYRR